MRFTLNPAAVLRFPGVGLALVLIGGSPALAQPDCDPCTIGTLFESPSEAAEALRTAVQQEVEDLAAPRFRVVFPEGARRIADGTASGVGEAVDRLLADPAVHIVLTHGPIAAAAVRARLGETPLPKPVIAAFVLDAEAGDFPIQTNEAGERVSGVENFAYLTFPTDPGEIARLREVVPFGRLTYLMDRGLLAAAPDIEAQLRQNMEEAGIEGRFVGVGASASEALAALPPDTEAVYVTPLPELLPGEFDALVRGLIARKLPSFSYLGRRDVDRGLLASLYVEADLVRLSRRIGLHVQRILLGEDAGSLPVDFRRQERLTLNMATARAIGIHPGWRVLADAERLHDELPADAPRLTLASAVREALRANRELLAQDRAVEAGLGVVRSARAPLLPQVSASSQINRVDADRAAGSFGILPEWSATGALSLSWSLFSDRDRAASEIERQGQVSREQAREELRLDIAHAAAVAYLNVLRAATFERIQRENLGRTRVHLALARSRREIGVARATEVVRWESQLANHRKAVIEAGATLEVARIELNRLRDRPLEEAFATTETGLDAPEILASAAFLDEEVDTPFAFALLRDFMAVEAAAASPELRGLDAAIAASERALLAARRAFWAPTVTTFGELGTSRSAEASSGLDLFPDTAATEPNALDWSVGLSASLPLFAGGGRFGERIRAREELAGLRFRRRSVEQFIEQRLRSALHFAAASFTGIGLAEEAAVAARRNRELVTDAYEQGAVSILDLIDAQNTALLAEESAATAVHDYLLDLMDAHRAGGRIEIFVDSPDASGFVERVRAYFRDAGYESRSEQE